MDERHSILRRTISILLVSHASGVVTSAAYQKSYLPDDSTSCELTSHHLPSQLYTTKVVYCSTFCTANPNCAAYCVTDTSCLLLDLTVTPGDLPQSEGGMDMPCYVPVKATGPRGTDLLRGKSVKEQDSWDDVYASIDTVVSGARCEKVKEDCFCTNLALRPSVIVDMGTPQPIASVVVTVSSFHPGYFKNVEVRVGSKGTRDDALLKEYTGSASAGERLVLRGSQTITGRYVSLWRDVFIANSLCLCLLEAYST